MGILPRVPGPGTVVVTVTADNAYATADMTTWTADGLWRGTASAIIHATASPRLDGTPGIEE